MDRKIKIEHDITPKMLSHLVTSFIESGGVNSWATFVRFFTWDETGRKTQVEYSFTWERDDGTVPFYEGRWSLEITDEDEETHTLGWRKLKSGCERPCVLKQVQRWATGDYDALDAGDIIQSAIYNEVRYG